EPWKVTDAPEDYVDQLLRGIVGVNLRIDRIEGKAKLSQNRSLSEATGAFNGLLQESPASPLLPHQRGALEQRSD
ncbi:MAG: FMN-binding negative transcriptional regulator, partial [Actinomycetota bacterium]